MTDGSQTLTVTIDGKTLQVPRGITILEAAKRNGVHIPTLCTLEGLEPFGGCRMCIVEIEGIKGYRTACTTKVEPGMEVKTQSASVKAERAEILQLILSEHPSSCLVCDLRSECAESKGSFRKSGVVTGCRPCPADTRCTLQELTEQLGIKEIKYPVDYRNIPIEDYDPFYDRDYNLCILCGRCIRVCDEVRGACTLTFKERGSKTVVGTAFDQNHMDAGCEFCGACVSVCPTGALTERSNRWEGKAEREETTTCALCGVGCQMRLQVKRDRVIGAAPDEGSLISSGQLCVKGRFGVNELVNNYKRLKKPLEKRAGANVEISWEDAISAAAKRLAACPPEKFALRISPNCTNEDLYVAQKFSRVVMRSHDVDTSARNYYGPGFGAYLDLMKFSVPVTDLHKASVIVSVGLDTRFGRSVAGVELRKAIKTGATLFTIHASDHNLVFDSHEWIQPDAGKELQLLRSLVRRVEKAKPEGTRPARTRKTSTPQKLTALAAALKQDSAPVILVGSEYVQRPDSKAIFETIAELAKSTNAGVITNPSQNNLVGSILMGAYKEVLPGGYSSSDEKSLRELSKRWGVDVGMPAKKRISKKKVLYLVGEVPQKGLAAANYVVYQNIYPPGDGNAADLTLPAAAFSEVDGTFVNGEGRIQRVKKAVAPPGEALPDWAILCDIARKMGVGGFEFSNTEEIRKEIAEFTERFADLDGTGRDPSPVTLAAEIVGAKRPRSVKTTSEFPFVLDLLAAEHTYRGFTLATWVAGAIELFPEGTLAINPEDARAAGISQGDAVLVTSAKFEESLSAVLTSEQPGGTLRATLGHGQVPAHGRVAVNMRKKNV